MSKREMLEGGRESFEAGVKEAEDFVREHMEEGTWAHTQSVRSVGKEIAKEEGADQLQVDLGALFHDIEKDHVPALDHAEKGASTAGEYLSKHGFDDATVKSVVACVAEHATPWAGQGPDPETVEAKVLFDADMVGQFSENGIIKHILKHKSRSYTELVDGIEQDLEAAQKLLLTETGKRIGAEKIRLVREFVSGARQGSSSDERALIELVLENRHKTYGDMLREVEAEVAKGKEEGTMNSQRIKYLKKFVQEAK